MVVATMQRFFSNGGKPPPETLRVFAFEAAKTMSRLISLYKSLADGEIQKLQRDVIKSRGVSYLNSMDEAYLLYLAGIERLQELNLAASSVSSLGQKCSHLALKQFDIVFSDLKHGIFDMKKLEFGTRSVQKIVEKMEKLVVSTAKLYSALEALAGMETAEKKVDRWKKDMAERQQCRRKGNGKSTDEKMAYQRKQIQHYREVSLWGKTYDKSVGLMARITLIVLARIYSVFRPYVSSHPLLYGCAYCLLKNPELHKGSWDWDLDRKEKKLKWESKSAPIPKTYKTTGQIGFAFGLPDPVLCNEPGSGCNRKREVLNVFEGAPSSTVGGVGLSLRYANVIVFAERGLHAPATIGEDARKSLYGMLTTKLKARLREKLRGNWMKDEEREKDEGEGKGERLLAEGWREAVEDIMDWLSPLAHDFLKWEGERSLEKQRFDTKTTVVLMQTLHYSDLEKTEAAIVEVLVGLSYIYRYQKRRSYIGGDNRFWR